MKGLMGNNNFTYGQETQELITLARSGTHEKIIRFLKNEKKGKLLDAPAGTGILVMNIAGFGYKDRFFAKTLAAHLILRLSIFFCLTAISTPTVSSR